MKEKVISYENLPIKFPLWPTVLAWLSLDYYQAPGWAWGVFGTVAVLWWIGCLIVFFTQEQKNIFE